MVRYTGTPDFRHDTSARTGILLTNLGTPDAPTPAALRRYLGEFLRDPRVVEVPRPLWWLILHGFILRFRPARSAHAYGRIWTEQGSPLLVIARKQAAAVEAALRATELKDGVVRLAMRYGTPSIRDVMREMRAANVQRLLVLPLYPQYAAATTASTLDAVCQELGHWRHVPELRFINHYHDDDRYIRALADSVRAHQQQHGRPDRLVMSFHGIPKHYFLAGDPYFCHCQKTARLVAEQLELQGDQWNVAFQSRFGRREWLKPYTDHLLQDLAREGTGHVQVICPGFSADCLETLEEIEILNKEIFLTAGGRTFSYIPALNDRPAHIEALVEIIRRHCGGWDNEASPAELLSATRTRARKLGAND